MVARVCKGVRFVDAFERLKEKNDHYGKIKRKESREVFPLFLNTSLGAIIFYYEYFISIENIFSAGTFATLFFIYFIYGFTVLIFCEEITKHYYLKNSLVVLCHSVCIYLWIWQDSKWAVAYFVGILFASAKIVLMFKIMSKRSGKNH